MVQIIDQTEMEELFKDDIEEEFCKLTRMNYNDFKDKCEEWKDMIMGITPNSTYKELHYTYYLRAVENIRIGLLPEVVVVG